MLGVGDGQPVPNGVLRHGWLPQRADGVSGAQTFGIRKQRMEVVVGGKKNRAKRRTPI